LRELRSDPLDEELDVFAHNDSEAAEARLDLIKLLQQLPERQRLPIVYTKLEGMSVAEAARVAGMSESAIKVGVHRGLKALAAMIRTQQ
jgi:RNA polymerase sigma-70 factor (ECF subfamily)